MNRGSYASLHRAIELNKRKSLKQEKDELDFQEDTIIETTQNVIETTFEDRIRESSVKNAAQDFNSNDGKAQQAADALGQDLKIK